ncbi:hypothetical protein SAMN05446935_8393 [Burkholderia sp. YR290]|nr:hypothetical protein SAMN05446935_8393 [Burkholderia sp. YR290]
MSTFWQWVAYILLFLAFGGLVLLLNCKYPMLRDDPTASNPERKGTSWSLARCQMALWTVLVATALFWLLLIYIFKLLGADHSDVFKGDLNPNIVGLLGISGATGIVSAAVDAQKDSMVQSATLSVRSSARVILNSSRQILRLLPTVTGPNRATGVAGALAHQSLQRLREQRARSTESMSIPVVTIQRNKRTAEHVSFLSDLLVDENGNSLHRLQMVLFTLAFGVYFFVKVGNDHRCDVEISSQALALMGVSSLLYVGFKIPGRSPNTPQTQSPLLPLVQAALGGGQPNANPGGAGAANQSGGEGQDDGAAGAAGANRAAPIPAAGQGDQAGDAAPGAGGGQVAPPVVEPPKQQPGA